MEGNSLGFDFTFFHVNLVPTQHDWNLLANTNEVTLDCFSKVVLSTVGETYGASWGRSCR